MVLRIISYLIPKTFYSRLSFEFQPSGSVLSTLNERSRTHRASLGRRVTSTTFVFHALIFLFVSIPALLILCSVLDKTLDSSLLLVKLPGPMFKLLDLVWKSSVPMIYLLYPPTVDEWEGLTQHKDWKQNGSTFLVRVPNGLRSKVKASKID